MNIDIFLFYLFSIFAVLSSLMVINLPNAIHCVLFLILVFCNVTGLLLLLGAEFISLMLIIVYVGAIAVLFLFVVMMLNIKTNKQKLNTLPILPIGLPIFFILFNNFSTSVYNFDLLKLQLIEPNWFSWTLENNSLNNIEVIGKVLYTHYSLLFIICGLILLVSMIGAIVLTMHQRVDVKKQKIDIQLTRSSSNVVKFITLRN